MSFVFTDVEQSKDPGSSIKDVEDDRLSFPSFVTLQQETCSSYDPVENPLASIYLFGDIHA